MELELPSSPIALRTYSTRHPGPWTRYRPRIQYCTHVPHCLCEIRPRFIAAIPRLGYIAKSVTLPKSSVNELTQQSASLLGIW